jgi:hypothetical protein
LTPRRLGGKHNIDVIFAFSSIGLLTRHRVLRRVPQKAEPGKALTTNLSHDGIFVYYTGGHSRVDFVSRLWGAVVIGGLPGVI